MLCSSHAAISAADGRGFNRICVQARGTRRQRPKCGRSALRASQRSAPLVALSQAWFARWDPSGRQFAVPAVAVGPCVCHPQRQGTCLCKPVRPTLPCSQVVGISKLRTKYESHEAKRQLCNSYDLFAADERILPSLPKLLGAIPPSRVMPAGPLCTQAQVHS